jgi:hypothetical protein
MASSQGTQPPKMNKREATLANASKQQTTALFLSTKSHARYTELTKKMTGLMENLCCTGEHSVQFFLQFFYIVKLYGLT